MRDRGLRVFCAFVREKNPPVTASPCQPPLGKGALETGDADCHDRFANWSRNDTVNKKRGGAAGHMGPALQPYTFVGQGPRALPGVQYGIGGRTEASASTEGLQGVQWAGDRKGRPY